MFISITTFVILLTNFPYLHIDHDPERKRKDLSDLIKVQPEKVGLYSLLELDAFNQNCKNTIAASTSGLIGSDQTASTSGASRSYFYPHSEDQHRVEISDSDIERLQSGKWMNDNLTDFYFRYLELHVSPTNGAITDYHFFNTFFYSELKEVLSTK